MRSGVLLGIAVGVAMLVSGVASASDFSLLYSFNGGADGANPVTGVIALNGVLYGTTQGGGSATASNGTVFAYDLATGKKRILHAFAGGAADGSSPIAAPVAFDNMLYGTTESGGAGGKGVVYALDPITGAERILHAFPAGRFDGQAPTDLIVSGKFLFGTTIFGGLPGKEGAGGTVFRMSPGSGAEGFLHLFRFVPDVFFPSGKLNSAQGLFYGTAAYGGSSSSLSGGIYAVDPATRGYSVVYGFRGGHDGVTPAAGMVLYNGVFYGTTRFGGGGTGSGSPDCTAGCGTVFSYNPKTKTEKIVYAFQGGADGAAPLAGLVAMGGLLYGTAFGGGSTSAPGGLGVIFAVNPVTGAETVVHTFQGPSDGANPRSALSTYGERIYGTTQFGGGAGNGALFALKP